MGKQVLCACTFCRSAFNNVGRYVSISTRSRHRRQEKSFKNISPLNNTQNLIYNNIFNLAENNLELDNLEKNRLGLNNLEDVENHESPFFAASDTLDNSNLLGSEFELETDEREVEPVEQEFEFEEQNSELDEQEFEIDEQEFEENDYDLSDNLVQGLRLLYVKNKYSLPNQAFNEIIKIFEISEVSLYKLQKAFKTLIPLEPKLVNMCWNFCCAFTKKNINVKCALIVSLVASGLFTDPRDIALIASTDGYQLFKKKQNDCWVILLLNANLPPNQRVKKKNLMITAIIPDPKLPKNFNSFLQPLVDKLKCLEALENKSESERYKIERETGVNGHSILFELRLISFPASFPIDIMHSLFENTIQHMFRHFNSKFFNNEKLNNADYKITTNHWNEIERIVEFNQKMMPSEFERLPINIQKYYNSLKAEDWYNWAVLYSLPLFQGHSTNKIEITANDELFGNSIFETGPPWATWQFPMERLCGMLIPLVHSQQNPYVNLINQSSKCVFNPPTYNEKLYSLFKEHVITKTELQKIKQYYATAFDLVFNQIKKYGKLQTKYRVVISSQLANHKGDISQIIIQL
ncbi:6283_t:CDS:2, partial [Gigaspora rosea]